MVSHSTHRGTARSRRPRLDTPWHPGGRSLKSLRILSNPAAFKPFLLPTLTLWRPSPSAPSRNRGGHGAGAPLSEAEQKPARGRKSSHACDGLSHGFLFTLSRSAAEGTGEIAAELAVKFGLMTRVVGIDSNPFHIEVARESWGHIPNLRLEVATAEQLPFPSGQVDYCYSNAAWHWFDKVKAAAEMRRLLKSGGGYSLSFGCDDEPHAQDDRTIPNASSPRPDWKSGIPSLCPAPGASRPERKRVTSWSPARPGPTGRSRKRRNAPR